MILKSRGGDGRCAGEETLPFTHRHLGGSITKLGGHGQAAISAAPSPLHRPVSFWRDGGVGCPLSAVASAKAGPFRGSAGAKHAKAWTPNPKAVPQWERLLQRLQSFPASARVSGCASALDSRRPARAMIWRSRTPPRAGALAGRFRLVVAGRGMTGRTGARSESDRGGRKILKQEIRRAALYRMKSRE